MASPQPAPSDSTQKLYNISTQSSDEYTYDGREAREGDRIPAPNTLNPFPTEDPQYALKSQVSPSQTRAQERRLDDDLAMLQAERQVTTQQQSDLHRSDTVHRTRSRRTDPVDEFDVNTNPVHEQNAVYRPPENPSTRLARIFKKIHNSSFLVRYFMYIIPVTGILLIPLLFGALLFKDAHVGGVQLMWFSIWLEIIWLTLWAGRVSGLAYRSVPRLTCTDCRQNDTLAPRPHLEPFHKQQQEVAGYGKAAGTPRDALLLVARHRNLVSSNHAKPRDFQLSRGLGLARHC